MENMTTPQHAIDAAKEIKECAESIIRNLREDITDPSIKDNMWVITAACHASVILQDLPLLTRHPDPELVRLREENESLKTLWTDMRVVLTQSRNANCLASYGATQADAVEAANRILNVMPQDVTTERENLRIERDALHSSVMPLLAERDQLRARVAELEASDEKRCEVMTRYGAELADLRRDREDLDWLEKHFHEVRRQDPGPTMDCEPVRFSVWTPEHGRTNRFTDLRSAVRAARAKDAKTEGGV